MFNYVIVAVLFSSVIAISGCTQKDRDAISDITYALTGVPGAKHKEQAKQEQAKQEQAQTDKKADDIIKFKKERDQWIGKSVDDLVLAWGEGATYNRADGGRHITYRERTYYQYSMLGSVSRYCDTLFVSNAKGIVKSWQSSGSCHYIQN